MKNDKLSFTPHDPRSAMKLHIDFRSIKSQKRNIVDATKPAPPPALLKLFIDKGGCYTFEFDNVADREECQEFVAKILEKHEETIPLIPSVPPENTVVSTGSEHISAEEVERQMKLLCEDSELRKLHMHFVAGNILQEYEFWEIRKVLNELNEVISRPRWCNLRNPHESLLGQLPHRTQDKLMDHWMVIEELLQHFWSAYPITSSVFKPRRIKDAMAQIYKKLQDLKESAQPNLRHQISQLVKPMIQALDAAFSHDLEQQQGSSHAGNKSKYPMGFERMGSSGLASR